jgi:hypothetical protein
MVRMSFSEIEANNGRMKKMIGAVKINTNKVIIPTGLTAGKDRIVSDAVIGKNRR